MPVTAAPWSYGCWFKVDADDSGTVISIANSAIDTMYAEIRVQNAAGGDDLEFRIQVNGGVLFFGTSTTTSQDTWHHALAVSAASNDHRVYLDGGGKGTSTTARAMTGVDRLGIGHLTRSSTTAFFSGRIFWPFMYNVALTDDEALLLGIGASPRSIRRNALKFFGEDIGQGGNFKDVVGFAAMTANNTPAFSTDNPFQAQRLGQRGRTRSRTRIFAA